MRISIMQKDVSTFLSLKKSDEFQLANTLSR